MVQYKINRVQMLIKLTQRGNGNWEADQSDYLLSFIIGEIRLDRYKHSVHYLQTSEGTFSLFILVPPV